MQRPTLAKRAWLLFPLATVAFYFYGLGHLPFIGPDEPRYAEVAREMFMRGDLVTPTLGGHEWFEKPALLYWIVMSGFAAFGVSEWAARFGMACAGLLTSLIIYWLVRRAFERADPAGAESRGVALGSATALASSAAMIGFSRGVNYDIILALTLTAALACFFVSELEGDVRRRRWWLAGFYAVMGAALLAKGLVGIVLPAGIIAAYFLMRRERPHRVARLSLLWGVPLALAVAAIWYVPVTLKHGWPFIDQFFIQHHFQRFVSNKYHHPHRFYYYVPVLLMLAFPWTAFLATALVSGVRRGTLRAQGVEARLRVFALAWCLVPVIFFSFSQSKLPGYILPALPGAALLVGDQLALFLRGEGGKVTMRLTGALLLLIGTGAVVYVLRTGYLQTSCAIIIAMPLVIAGAFVLFLARMARARIVLTASAMFVAVVLTIHCAAWHVGESESAYNLLQQADARGYASAPVYHMYTMDYTTVYYAAGRLAYGADGEPVRYEGAAQVAEEAERRGGPILVLIHSKYAEQLTEYKRIQTEVIGDNGTVTLVAVRPR
ncbi:MAG TPA: glycosyltransferase family 39 protein [Pyrinomonadaceae bacterium]